MRLSRAWLVFAVSISSTAHLSTAQAAGPRILFIGDSHSEGTFGSALYEALGQQVTPYIHLYGVGGSTPEFWLEGRPGKHGYVEKHFRTPEVRTMRPQTPRLQDLIARHVPDLTIIELGTNFIWSNDERNFEAKAFELAAQASAPGKPCVWIGPPGLGAVFPRLKKIRSAGYREKLERAKVAIRAAVRRAGCLWIDSAPYAAYPAQGGDAVHYDLMPGKTAPADWDGPARARKWAESVATEIADYWRGKQVPRSREARLEERGAR